MARLTRSKDSRSSLRSSTTTLSRLICCFRVSLAARFMRPPTAQIIEITANRLDHVHRLPQPSWLQPDRAMKRSLNKAVFEAKLVHQSRYHEHRRLVRLDVADR